MVYWLGAAMLYLVAAFLGSAAIVRYAPRNPASALLRRRLAIFPLAPAIAVVAAICVSLRRTVRLASGIAAGLTGQRLSGGHLRTGTRATASLLAAPDRSGHPSARRPEIPPRARLSFLAPAG